MISNQPQSDRPGESHGKGQVPDMSETGGRLKQHMKDVAADAREKGKSMIDRQKEQVSQTLRHVSEALHKASEKLTEENDPTVANVTETLSERVERFAEYVDGMELSEVVDRVESFARRQPHLFLGGMFLLGLAAARFLKASPPANGFDSHEMQEMSMRSGRSHGVTGTRGAAPEPSGALMTTPSRISGSGLSSSSLGPGGMSAASGRQQSITGQGSMSGQGSTSGGSSIGQSGAGSSGPAGSMSQHEPSQKQQESEKQRRPEAQGDDS